MRRNGGGSPGTAALLVSYLFDTPDLPLFDIVHPAPEPVDHREPAGPWRDVLERTLRTVEPTPR